MKVMFGSRLRSVVPTNEVLKEALRGVCGLEERFGNRQYTTEIHRGDD
jgi:hypothetical protein